MINSKQKAIVKELKNCWVAARLAGNTSQANEIIDLIYEWYLDNIGELTTRQITAFQHFFDRYDYL